jgi:D-glycero-alpha-D-manno-heptose 1-phosphate guanylyltransferase
MISEVMILSGGMGTRLKDTVPDLPKVMAPVSGHPFIYYLIKNLDKKGLTHFVFLLGYKHDVVINYLDANFKHLNKTYVIESIPLGTGGAILNGLQYCKEQTIAITNGDTYFDIDLSKMEFLHDKMRSDCTLALKPMKNYDRYGSVLFNNEFLIIDFIEKKFTTDGYINGGFYLIDKNSFLKFSFQEVFSFEKDFLENKSLDKKMYATIHDSYFIDIGIPEDYSKAQHEMNNIL